MAIIRVNSVPLDFRCPFIPRLKHKRLLIEDAYFISLCATKMSHFLGHPMPVLQIHKLLLAHLQQSLLWDNIFVWLKIKKKQSSDLQKYVIILGHRAEATTSVSV